METNLSSLRQKDSLFNFFSSLSLSPLFAVDRAFSIFSAAKRARRESNFSVFEKLNKNTKVNCFHCYMSIFQQAGGLFEGAD
jgi:hypothetical protein